MGIIRFIFALSVVTFHSTPQNGFYIFDRTAAVLSFFIISGFYMALILESKYTSKIGFYISRFLRIFPFYIIALTLIIILGISKYLILGDNENSITHYLNYTQHLSGNHFIIETINFILRNITLIINKDYFEISQNLAGGYLIVNQAWSIQVELLFYLIVPFILLIKKNFLFYVSLYFIIFYGIILPFNLISESSLTFIFLNYLIYFLLGIISYKYIYSFIRKRDFPNFIIILLLFAIFLVTYRLLPVDLFQHYLVGIIYYLLFAVFISFAFLYTKNNKIDRLMGELSYPIFIFHIIFIKLVASITHGRESQLNTFLVIVFTLIFSLVMVKYVQNPIDHIRHSLNPKPKT